MVNNSLGPHFGGNGLNHGIQIRNGPHKGRLALAERLDCPSAADETPAYWRSYVLYSDDEGDTWTTGQLLPEGWTECQVTQMRNGSLLMTSRLQAKTPNHYRPYPDNTTGPLDKENKRRAFARSDDGGHTWAELWYLADRQPEIARYTSECAHGITSDPNTGELFWAHPGGGRTVRGGHDDEVIANVLLKSFLTRSSRRGGNCFLNPWRSDGGRSSAARRGIRRHSRTATRRTR